MVIVIARKKGSLFIGYKNVQTIFIVPFEQLCFFLSILIIVHRGRYLKCWQLITITFFANWHLTSSTSDMCVQHLFLKYFDCLIQGPSNTFFWKMLKNNKCLKNKASSEKMIFFAKIGIVCKSIAGPLPRVVQAYTQPYSFGGRLKLIICQIRHELGVTIHEISTSWKNDVRWRTLYFMSVILTFRRDHLEKRNVKILSDCFVTYRLK